MGLAGYYRIFIAGFSNIAHPITYFQKNGIKFEWIAKCEENFNSLKELLTSAPILKIVDPNENFFGMYRCMQGRARWSPHSKWVCH
jgi:hypothetical protein